MCSCKKGWGEDGDFLFNCGFAEISVHKGDGKFLSKEISTKGRLLPSLVQMLQQEGGGYFCLLFPRLPSFPLLRERFTGQAEVQHCI